MKKSANGNSFIYVEGNKACFNPKQDMGIEFKNSIDAWSRMQFLFRSQIKQLQELNSRTPQFIKQSQPLTKADLRPLFYSMRERID
jgi:hypothetical protein